ncbi:hypothetical protein [Propionimicrobium sp. PCR01-08-3]|uniref:hypothetical protein n=1 Tax=Propionimicrobium sp. PCR01-08-3 TaxID=3052086 RepID=UPI00255CB932|nr:hypothetical protein [Propionimicrobium sp. PCR01-08-3]WIY84005.1 hypothetical protein QQ658_06615 [Propionimicrobium sp. PCR01-08-3]
MTTERGLMILEAESGRIIARPDEIAGLGADFIAGLDAYALDADDSAIVALTASGRFMSIPLGTTTAGPASSEIEEKWHNLLHGPSGTSQNIFTASPEHLTQDRATLPDGTELDVRDIPGFEDSSIVCWPDSRWPVGADAGFVILEESETLVLWDLTAGRAVDSVQLFSAPQSVGQATDGTVVLIAEQDTDQAALVIATPTTIESTVIGDRGWLGR